MNNELEKLMRVKTNVLSPEVHLYTPGQEVMLDNGLVAYIKAEYRNTVSLYIPEYNFLGIAKRVPVSSNTKDSNIILKLVSDLPNARYKHKQSIEEARYLKALADSARDIATYEKKKARIKEYKERGIDLEALENLKANDKPYTRALVDIEDLHLFTDVPVANNATARNNTMHLYNSTKLTKEYAAPTPRALAELVEHEKGYSYTEIGLLTGTNKRKITEFLKLFNNIIVETALHTDKVAVLSGVAKIDVFRFLYALLEFTDEDVTPKVLSKEFLIKSPDTFKKLAAHWGYAKEEWCVEPKYTDEQVLNTLTNKYKAAGTFTAKEVRNLNLEKEVDLTSLGYMRLRQEYPELKRDLIDRAIAYSASLAKEESTKQEDKSVRKVKTSTDILIEKEDRLLAQSVRRVVTKEKGILAKDIPGVLGIDPDHFELFLTRNPKVAEFIREKGRFYRIKADEKALKISKVKAVIKADNDNTLEGWAKQLGVNAEALDTFLRKHHLHQNTIKLTQDSLKSIILSMKDCYPKVTQDMVAKQFNLSLARFRTYIDVYNINYTLANAEASREYKKKQLKTATRHLNDVLA